MIKHIFIIVSFLILVAGVPYSQEVLISGFPLGVGGSIEPTFFEPYFPQLQELADTLAIYPMARVVITGGADGFQYHRSNDAKNPSLALGRAHALRMLLMRKFKVDSAQIVLRSEDVKATGERYRYVSARLVWDMVELEARVKAVEDRPPIEKHFMEVQEVSNYLNENMGLQFGVGITSSPFGGMPIFTSAVTWKRKYFVEGFFAHTFWNSTYVFQSAKLDTKRRMAGGQLIVYPFTKHQIGVLAGWLRTEEVSDTFYKYVRMSEGPILGLRAAFDDLINVSGAWNPSKQRTGNSPVADWKSDQFLLSVTANVTFGGKR